MSNAFRVNRYACPKTEFFRQPENHREIVEPPIEYVEPPRPTVNFKNLDYARARAADRPLVEIEPEVFVAKPRRVFVPSLWIPPRWQQSRKI